MLQFYEIVSTIKSYNIACQPVMFDPNEFGLDLYRIRFLTNQELETQLNLNAAFQLYANSARHYTTLRQLFPSSHNLEYLCFVSPISPPKCTPDGEDRLRLK